MSTKKSSNRIDTLQLKPSDASQAIRHMIQVNLKNAELGKKRRGLFMWGGPGISKSSLVEQIANELNLKLIDVRLTQMEPTDLRGIPVPVGLGTDTVEVKWAIPAMLPKCDEGKSTCNLKKTAVETAKYFKGLTEEERKIKEKKLTASGLPASEYWDGAIILLDELPNAAPSVQAGSYQLVLDGSLGEYIVPDNAVVMAAGNRETDKGSTFKMPTPLMNRFVHIEVKADFDDWQTYALTVGFDKDVVGYLSAFKHELYMFDPKSASRGFPTPRSWEAVSDIRRDNPNISEIVMMALIGGAVGDGVAVKFLEHCKNAAKLPKADDVLDGKVKEMKSTETSLAYALTTALCYELKERFDDVQRNKSDKAKAKKFDENVDNFLGFMMTQFRPEMTIMGARTMLHTFRIRFNPTGMKNWSEFSDKYQSLILA